VCYRKNASTPCTRELARAGARGAPPSVDSASQVGPFWASPRFCRHPSRGLGLCGAMFVRHRSTLRQGSQPGGLHHPGAVCRDREVEGRKGAPPSARPAGPPAPHGRRLGAPALRPLRVSPTTCVCEVCMCIRTATTRCPTPPRAVSSVCGHPKHVWCRVHDPRRRGAGAGAGPGAWGGLLST